EHLPDPLAELREIYRILRSDGALVVEVPNSASLTFRLCGRRWLHLDLPRHLQHFTPGTLQHLLRCAGFTPVRYQNFHLSDFYSDFYSFMDRLGVSQRTHIHRLGTDFRHARLASRAVFLGLGPPLGLFCLLYAALPLLLDGNGEVITVIARKTGG
ncbi:MAG TPA: methyltransferase domain-containing protein, partial [Dehalococcoidia bacterium]|nr:methyltransferase domain-containing protein [Dehalococcoidia bacterium]